MSADQRKKSAERVRWAYDAGLNDGQQQFPRHDTWTRKGAQRDAYNSGYVDGRGQLP